MPTSKKPNQSMLKQMNPVLAAMFKDASSECLQIYGERPGLYREIFRRGIRAERRRARSAQNRLTTGSRS